MEFPMKRVLRNIVKYLVVLFILLITLFPVFWLLSTSLKNPIDQFAVPPMWIPNPLTFDHYQQTFVEQEFTQYLLNSTVVSLASTFLSLVAGTLAAYSLARFHFPGNLHFHLSFWILSTRMFPPIVTILPLFAIMRFAGLVNTKLGLIIAYTGFNLPFVVWMMRGFFQEIPMELEEAAMVDGSTRMRAFRKIILPLAAPGLAATAIFALIICWNEFLFALILTQTKASQTLPIGISANVGQYKILWGPMSASGIVAIVPILLFAFLVQRHLVRGMSFGAIKG
jgi:multiple sugar transport system permease protein